MKYIAQIDGSYTAFDEAAHAYKALSAIPAERRPVFLSSKDKGVKKYLKSKSDSVANSKAVRAQ